MGASIILFSFGFWSTLLPRPVAPAQSLEIVTQQPQPIMTCRAAIGTSLQDQGARQFSQTLVLTSLVKISGNGEVTELRVRRTLRSAHLRQQEIGRLVPMAVEAVEFANATGLCDRNGVRSVQTSPARVADQTQ